MPILDTSRKHESELVKDFSDMKDYSFATVGVEGSGAIEPIGTPVFWDATAGAFTPYVKGSVIAAATANTSTGAITYPNTSLPNDAVVAITCGTKEGRGVNRADVTLSSTATDMTVVYRSAQVVMGGIKFASDATADEKAAFRLALEKQGVSVIDSATGVAPSFEA